MTDITGVTGQVILRASVHGERDPLKLAQLRNPACKSSEDELAKALTGTWRNEQLFILQQALALFDFYTHQLAECDARVAQQFAAMKPRFESDEPPRPLPRVKPGSKSKNQPRYDARAQLARITGVDLVAVTGISAAIAQTILSEVGTDRGKFPTVKHFCSWLGLAPRNDVSGGNVWRSRTLQVVRRATQAFHRAAQSVARLGPQQATVATTHKIARVV
jgi:hypothetical protein